MINDSWPGVVVCDIRLPAMSGTDLQRKLHEMDPDLPVILITGHGGRVHRSPGYARRRLRFS